MSKIKNILCCGFGEVGKGIVQLDKESGYVVDIHDPFKNYYINREIDHDLIHICFPYKKFKCFKKSIGKILDQLPIRKRSFKRFIVINSTIQRGVASKLQNRMKEYMIIHSPVRGTHPNILDGLKKYVKFVGYADLYGRLSFTSFILKDYYESLGIEYQILKSADECALGKIITTTHYGLEIAFCNVVNSLCEEFGIDFNESYRLFMKDENIGREYIKNKNGRARAKELIPRPIMTPGRIGGHCVIQNLQFLKKDCKKLYKFIKKNSGIK